LFTSFFVQYGPKMSIFIGENTHMKKIVVLTGAGISEESGIKTFRDAGGLWEGHDIMDVASPEGWRKNREIVLEFYNLRRKQLQEVIPNDAHHYLVKLEEKYNVVIVTQNVDDLHERAGSKNIIHLHGELLKVRSTLDESLIYDWKDDIKTGDKCDKGSQLRPHIVWFGEEVPMMSLALKEVIDADIIMVVGTSLQVYPAAGILTYAPPEKRKIIIDRKVPDVRGVQNIEIYEMKASEGMKQVAEKLLKEAE
jgi:NAD-dependent deacetylase